MGKKLLIIGVSGVTCGGKTTMATTLNKILPNSKVISQDDYFLGVDDPRHVMVSELNHINFDILTSLDMEQMYKDTVKLIDNKNLKAVPSKMNFDIPTQNDLQKLLYLKASNSDVEFLIVEGFSIFNYKPLLPFMHLKYYFTLSEEECRKRRLTRVYEPPDCTGYFEKVVWPEHLQQLKEVKENVDNVKYFSESDINPVEVVMLDILSYL